ncbi:hypothetical protein P389DRAFT_165845 [Cystobasidium minutum MCA 4210]|uniref:uncharacterized protein n=1 Tax=Cystobasidium minutum MCA 4210 TaxID=1397322 RepID=UPI0034CD7BA4|eukprot:jgi/Rhomi1/165845/fgenesh1_kg.1_\
MASTAGVHSPPQQPSYASPPPAAPSQYAAYLSGAQQQLYQQAAANVRPGTLPPGVCVKIGEHEVTIERFLSEGGFAHVYVVRSSRPIPSPSGSSEVLHVLKRVAVPDKPTLKEVRWEVDVMKLLRGHKHIVNLIEASAAPIPGTAGYEVFILMEYCSGGGIIDMMNTRLQNRLTEAEILTIFSDVVEAVCWMHTRNPPLMHRDLKVENILLAGPDFYKVCDFGSATTPKRAPQSMQEIQALEAELNKTTTLQYRAPEMCDVWSRKEVGLPADIWALGVLLYKLCFYTTPFEEQGPLAILNVQYKMPSYPNYSQDIRKLIASMLVEPINQRPTAWQVHQQVCRLRGTRPNKEYEQHKSLDVQPSPRHASLNGAVSPSFSSRPTSSMGAVVTAPSGQTEHNITQEQLGVSPMRRGRPGKSGQTQSISSHPASNLHSEWDVPSASSSSLPSQHSSTAHAPVPGAHNPYAHHESGFGDSFTPSIPAITGEGVSSSKQDHHDSGHEVKSSRTASATAAIFEELSNPGSTVKQAPTLASLAAERSGGSQPVRAPSGTSQRVQQYMQQFSQPSSQPSTSTQDLRRVSPGKPLGPRSALPVPPSATSQGPSRTPSYSSTSSKPSIKVEGGTQTDRVASSPPVKPPKPNLKEQETIKGRFPQRTSSNLSTAAVKSPQTDSEGGRELERFPSIDDWESTGFSPPAESVGTVSASPQQMIQNTKQQLTDLLGDDVGGMTGQPPSRTASYKSTASAPIHASSSYTSTSSVGRQGELSVPSLSTSTEAHTPSIISQISGTGSRSVPDAAPSESSSSDSEDEEGPEEPTGHHYGHSTPPAVFSPGLQPATAESTSIASGSNQRSPGRGPPILAPKPKVGGISSIVSRYENISTSGPAPATRQNSDLNRAKPVKPPKPNYTASVRQSGYETSHSGPDHASLDDFSTRYPSLQEDIQSQSLPTRTLPSSDRSAAYTKANAGPARQNSDSSTSSARARPQSMHFPASPALSRNGESAEQRPQTVEEDGEEEYQGVANLRDRWQKMHSGVSDQRNGQQQDGLSRRATLNTSRWNRN